MTDISHKISQIKKWLAAYDGPDISIMEVCGSHTAAISKYGISGMLSERLHLISGPGCPVCVTPTGYIDRLIELSMEEHTTVVTFGDLIRVPGRKKSLAEAKGEGANVEMVYSPMDILRLAKEQPLQRFVFAAVKTRCASMMVEVAEARFAKSRFDDLAYSEPFYLKAYQPSLSKKSVLPAHT